MQPRDLPPRGYSAPQPAPEWPPSLGPSSDRRYNSEPRSQSRDSYPAFGEYPPSRSTGRDPVASSGRDPYAPQPAPVDYAARVMAPPVPREEPRWAEAAHHGHQASGLAAQDRNYSGEPAQAAAADDANEAHYEDDAPLRPEDEEAYDDPPSALRRGGIATAVALILCAMLGTAGAYAYRSYSHPTGKEPPPVINADNSTPAKVVPPTGEARSGKQISERFATAATGNEQLVSRQEEPVALREPGTATAPRVVLPAPVQPVQPTPPAPFQSAAPPPPAPAAVPPPAAGSEPKRVRTVTIRPDGTDPSGRPVATNTTPPAPRATGTTPPAPRAAPPPRSGGPLSLEPAGEPPRPRTANAPPRDSLSGHSPSGGYVVQLSSQKTEGEAFSSYRALQSKFPNELGNRQVIVRRADLGAKGVVYRTNVGPFGSAHEAQQFCASYKAAGGQCIVPTN